MACRQKKKDWSTKHPSHAETTVIKKVKYTDVIYESVKNINGIQPFNRKLS